MMKPEDIRNASFSGSLSGYNKTEVDDFLEKVEQDYQDYEAYTRSLKEKLNALASEAEQYKKTSDSLNNVLISAQQLADKIVEDAKIKATEIERQAQMNADKVTAEAKDLIEDFDEKFSIKRAQAEQEYKKECEQAKKEQEAIKLVTNEIISKQQIAFDRLKLEIAQFKKEVLAQYKAQFELISKLPEDIIMDADRIAKAIEYEMANGQEEQSAEEIPEEPVQEAAGEIFEEPAEEPEQKGFVISIEDDAEPAQEDGSEADFSNDFFKQSK